MEEAMVIRGGGTSKCFGVLAVLMATIFLVFTDTHTVYEAGGLDLDMGYPRTSVKSGDSLNVPVTLENYTGVNLSADLKITAMPEGWKGYLQGGSYQVNRVHVKNGEEGAQVILHVTVPKELTGGTYTVEVKAPAGGGLTVSLPASFMVNEISTRKGSFTSEYPQQEGITGTSSSFSTILVNNEPKTQSYSLSPNAPSDWGVSFTPTGKTTEVAALEVESGTSRDMTVSMAPPERVAAGEYDISCSAISAEEALDTSLKVVTTDSYGLEVSIPDSRLSFDAYTGRSSDVTFSIANTGNVGLENVTLNSSLPTGWTVTYNTENNMIPSVPVGSITEVVAYVKSSSETITGDYVNTFATSCEQTQSSAGFRASVKATTIWGVMTVVIILCTAGGLGYAFRRYGRGWLVWIVGWRGIIVMDYEEEMMIRTEHLSRSYGEKETACDLTLEIRRGEIFGLLGPDGAGKTTTAPMLLELTGPTGGSAYIGGRDCARQAVDAKRMMGCLPDNVGFYPDMTGQENLRFTRQLNGLPNNVTGRRMEELLKKVGMTKAADQKARTYSQGVRQCLGVADVLMKDPKVVVMDESTLGIDPGGMRELMILICGLTEDGKRTILISSHQLYQIQQICDRVGLFVDDKLIACGRISELAGQMRREGHYALEAAASPDGNGFEELLRSPSNVEQVERTDDFYVVHSRSDLCRGLNRRTLGKGHTLHHLRQQGNDLDKTYRRYFGKGEQKNGSLNQEKSRGLLSFGGKQR